MVIRAGVVGHPIAHSLSPRLHGRWLENYGIDGSYEAIDGGTDFGAVIERLREAGFAGCNVTLPFKAEAVRLADEVTPLAARLGTGNTLVFAGGRILADNTDVYGMERALRPHMDARHRTALVLGAGGVAPAAVAALQALGIEKLRIANRTPETAAALAERFGLEPVLWAARDAAADTDILVNATALGLPGKPPLDVSLGRLPAHAVVMDAVYTPQGTALIDRARGRGLTGVDGLTMLVHQAIPGFARWFGVEPDDPDAAEAQLRSAA
ncbi:shikimate dehydrogenase family protein [Parvularcula dongshanensis]|uniref:Shikimate dehydrogenase (NADP(+)) n=1 Tax=Parvularcula dongshanensis TaxID=1173995 RepID=A0A840HZN5_9PROT|nr:shikimate dehydrogenase [Parvularcula dongshanensis]MBB4658039.1 shikimate dehydrogenase [Parvularcula dongshanensis]